MKCKENYEFVVLDELGLIELRTKKGEFISSIACRKCIPELEKAIAKIKKESVVRNERF